MVNYLFVCQHNIMRSPYSEEWFDKYCKEHSIDAEVKSAGFSVSKSTRTELTDELINWADEIVVMEGYMKDEIIRRYSLGNNKSIVNLNIPDIFYRLVEISNPPYDDTVSPQEAAKLLEDGFRKYCYWRHFGKKFMDKILEAKLEDIINGESK